MIGHLFFHAPCFDGIASAVLAADFLGHQEWATIHLHPANYDLKPTWLATPLPQPCAIVDFLFHPAATFWADHHPTTFLDDAAHRQYMDRSADRRLVYDVQAGSCAGLLWRHLQTAFGHRNEQFEELVRWAEKIDAARYESVDEVFRAESPAIQINAALNFSPNPKALCLELAVELKTRSLAEIANRPDIRRFSEQAIARQRQGLELFARSARLTDDGIVIFDADDPTGLVNRYSPFHFYPDARYSAGIVRQRQGAKITAMRNPWREFPCAHLGRLCEPLGGGGHLRVGSIALPAEQCDTTAEKLDLLLAGIRNFHAGNSTTHD